MRGRRFGRNRNLPPAPPSSHTAASSSSGSVRVVADEPTTVGEAEHDDTAPDDTAPEDTAPDDTAPEDTAPADVAAVLDGARPRPVRGEGTVTRSTGSGGELAPDGEGAVAQQPAPEVAAGETAPPPGPAPVGTTAGPEPQPEAAGAPDDAPTPQAAAATPLPRVLAVANQKGGVGKTTTSVNLGAALAELGFRVLVVDLDPQGNATTGLGIDARNFELSMYDVLMRDASLEDCVEPTSMKNLFVAPATIALAGAEIELVPAFSRELKLRKAIEAVLDDFDYILIDCPPSLGLITVNALAAAGEVLVPIQCEYYALEGLSQLMSNVRLVASNLNPRLEISTIVLTMYDARTKLADQVAHEVRSHFGAKVCRIVIPRTVRLSEAPSFGQPITAFDPSSRGAIAYRELAKEVSGGTS